MECDEKKKEHYSKLIQDLLESPEITKTLQDAIEANEDIPEVKVEIRLERKRTV